MSDEVMCDEQQADFFQRLLNETEFRTADLSDYADVGSRTANRVVNGDSLLRASTVRQLLARHPDQLVRYRFAEYITDAAGMEIIVIDPADCGRPIDADTVQGIRQLADALEMRRQHQADGVIDPHEREEEINTYKSIAKTIHRALHEVVEQPVTMRAKARKLSINTTTGGAA